jgi:hypothetical protein
LRYTVDGKKATGYYTTAKKMVQNGTVRREKGKPKGTRQECDFVVGREGKKNPTKASFQPP